MTIAKLVHEKKFGYTQLPVPDSVKGTITIVMDDQEYLLDLIQYPGMLALSQGTIQENEKLSLQGEISEPKQARPGPGLLKGKITYMAPDFDDPLEDLKEYME